MTYVDRLREVFAELGDTTAADISRRIGISHATATNYLKGRLPAADELIKIANHTNVSLNWLLTGNGPKYSNQTNVQSQGQENVFSIPLTDREVVLLQRKAQDHRTTPEAWLHSTINKALNEMELLPWPPPGEEYIEVPLYQTSVDKLPNERLGAAFKQWLSEIIERAST